jgi:hypothetical protein
MNTQRMNHFTYVGELDLSEKQERNLPFADTFPENDRELLLGDDFDTYASKTEINFWNGLTRTSIQNFPSFEALKKQMNLLPLTLPSALEHR